MEVITSRNNSGVKDYVKLTTSKKYRDEQDVFTIESLKLVCEAANSDIVIKKVFVTQTCFDENYDALQKLFEKCNNTYIIEEHVKEKMANTNNSQGIFAICEKFTVSDKLPTSGKYILLCGLQDSGNVGTIIRTAAALSVDGVIVSDDNCDFYSQKVVRASMGAIFQIAMYNATDAASVIKELNPIFSTYCAVLSENSVSLDEVKFDANSIVVVGNEGNGLPEKVVDECKEKIIIPMSDKTESLNAAIATAILIWEMSK